MWNPFSRSKSHSDERRSPAPIEPSEISDAPPPPRRGSIADVEFIGNTAVATLTVTQLSQMAGSGELAVLLDELGETGARHFVLDLQNVQHMDSGCLGVLVGATRRMGAHGGRIALVNADRNVSYLFRLTQLDRVFPICRDVMGALAAVERTPDDLSQAG